MNSNFNTYGRREADFGGAPTSSSSGFRGNNGGSGFQGGMQMRPLMGMGMRGGPMGMRGGPVGMGMRGRPTGMGMRGGPDGFRGRMQAPFGAGRGSRPFGGVPSSRDGEFEETHSVSSERRMPVVQGRPPMRAEEEPQRRPRVQDQVLEAPVRLPRDISRGGESLKSRPQERSFRNRDQHRAQPKPGSVESQERARDHSRNGRREKRPDQTQRSDRPRADSDAIWVRADDSAHFYVRIAKMRFYRGKLEEVKIHAAGKSSIYTAFKAVEVLQRYGYADIGGIRTSKLEKEYGRSISKVEILLKKTPDFEKIFDDFEKSKSQRDRGVPGTARAKSSPRQRGQASPTQLPQKEEIKESAPPPTQHPLEEAIKEATPKKPDELQLLEAAGSAEEATTAKSASSLDKADYVEAFGVAGTVEEIEVFGKVATIFW